MSLHRDTVRLGEKKTNARLDSTYLRRCVSASLCRKKVANLCFFPLFLWGLDVRGKTCWDIATSWRYLYALPLPLESLAIHGKPRYCKKIKHRPNMCWDPRPAHAACMLQAARANMVSVILEDNYTQFRILSLGQHRAALKNTVKRRTNTGRSSLSLTHTPHTNTHIRTNSAA